MSEKLSSDSIADRVQPVHMVPEAIQVRTCPCAVQETVCIYGKQQPRLKEKLTLVHIADYLMLMSIAIVFSCDFELLV